MTVRTSTRLAAGTAALAAALFMTACTSSEQASDGHTDHSQESTEQEPVIAGEPAAFNDADVTFASMMVPHHEQAVELSALVPDRSTNPELTALAQQIQAAQEPEINTMNAFLVQWNQGADQHAGHDMSSMEGMVDAATMTRLESLQGAEFDTLWLQSMIAHHEGAIAMAKTELADGTNPDAKALAQHIIDGQQAEIDQMKTMLGGS